MSKSERIRKYLKDKPSMSAAQIAKKVGCSVNLVYVIKSKSGLGVRRRKAGGGRKRKASPRRSTKASGDLGDLVASVREIQAERDRLQKAVQEIAAVLDRALR